MCIILHAINSPEAVAAALHAPHLRTAWTGNPHGAGIAYRAAPGSRVRIIKGLMTADSLCAAAAALLRTVRPYEVAVHLRYATHGDRGPDMTHPFRTEWGAMVHNGILRGPGLVAHPGESDTAAAARIVSRVEPRAAAALIREAWLSGSRVLLMRHGADALRLGDWERSTVRGLVLSQAYSLPELVAHRPERGAGSRRAGGSGGTGRQSLIWSRSDADLVDRLAGGGSVSSCDAEGCGDADIDDVAAAQAAQRAADAWEEARERAKVRDLRRAKREAAQAGAAAGRRALGMGPAAPAAVRAASDRGDPETRAAVDALPPLPGLAAEVTGSPAPAVDGEE